MFLQPLDISTWHQSGESTAARVAGHADSFGIDLFTAQQVIKSSDSIIDTPGTDIVAGKKHTAVEKIVLSHIVQSFLVGILTSFPCPMGSIPSTTHPLRQREIITA